MKIILSPGIYSLYRTNVSSRTLKSLCRNQMQPLVSSCIAQSRGQSGVMGYCYTAVRIRSVPSFMLRKALFPIS